MENTLSTLLATFLCFLYFKGGDASLLYLEVHMKDGSIYHGFLDSIRRDLKDTYPWTKKPNAKVHSEYEVLVKMQQTVTLELEEQYLQQIEPADPRLVEQLRRESRSDGHYPKEAKIFAPFYYTASGFVPYKGGDPKLKQAFHVYITIKGTNIVEFAPLHEPARGTVATKHPETIARFNARRAQLD